MLSNKCFMIRLGSGSLDLFFILGVFIFAIQRYISHSESREFRSESEKRHISLSLMGDIFNTYGQRTGGRTDDWSSNNSSYGVDGEGNSDYDCSISSGWDAYTRYGCIRH